MKLNELKTRHAELLVLNTDICKQIEESLKQELPCYYGMNTEIDLSSVKDDSHANLYKVKIKGLETKINHANGFLVAIKLGEYLESFDYFNEIGNVIKENE